MVEEAGREGNVIKNIRDNDQAEKDSFKELLDHAIRWNQSRMLRDFIIALEQEINKDKTVSNKLTEWIRWAKRKADWHDPLKRKDNFFLADYLYGNSDE